MAEEVKPAEPAKATHISVKKTTLIAAAIGVAVVIILLLWRPWQTADAAIDEEDGTFYRDEPTKKQIYQGNYEAKVRTMLANGMTPAQISKETGIKIADVRKIKREMMKQERERKKKERESK